MGSEKVAFWLCCNARCWSIRSIYFASILHHLENILPFLAIYFAVYWMSLRFLACLFSFCLEAFFDCLFRHEESEGSMRLILDSISLEALMIHSDAVHELYVDMSIYGVILCLCNGFGPVGFPELFNNRCLPVVSDYDHPSFALLSTCLTLVFQITTQECLLLMAIPIWSPPIQIRSLGWFMDVH
jgi:hypothetical protein